MESQDTIFLTARDIPDPAERAAYLTHACGNDADLRQRIEAMLRDATGADEFFGPDATVASSASVIEGPSTVIGRYKLLEKIGEGGMGVVYMAEQREPVIRRVALKIIKLGMDTKQVIARFEAERQALALMDHPNIAKVLDGGATESGRPYFVMDLVPGLPITQFCDEANLSTRDRLELFLEVCSAIQHAHQKGIIHRDIKPSNILVTLHGDKPVPKVIDFGVAKATQGRLTEKTLFTQFQQFIGTPAYMSPEQASLSGLDIDTRSDIYALGVLLYELLTGRTPFDAKELLKAGLDEMRRTIREQQPPRPSNRISTLQGEDLTTAAKHRRTDPPKLVHLVRGDLDWIVMKALEKDRARRYETANGLAADILRHINCEPVVARPPSRLYEFQKTVRRHKFGFAATAALITLLAVGVLVSRSQTIRARRAEQEQARLRQQAQTEAAKSRQVAQFLKDMLKGVGPSVALGRDTTMLREILDKTAERIGTDLKDQPEVEIELRLTLAQVYNELQLYEKMEETAREALRLARAHFGEENLVVADALGWIGRARALLGDMDEAEGFIRQAIAMERKLRGEDSVEEARCLNDLGYILSQQAWLKEGQFQSKLSEAETATRAGLAIFRKRLGNDSSEIAWTLNTLNLVLENEGKLPEAEAAIREGIAIRERINPAGHPGNIALYERLGRTILTTGSTNRLQEAEACLRKALELDERIVGKGKLSQVHAHLSLGEVLERQGKLDEAEIHYRQAAAIARKEGGADALDLPWPLSALANLLRQRGKLTEARAAAEEAVAICQRNPDRVSPSSQRDAFAALGDVLTDLGDTAAVETLDAQQLQYLHTSLPPDDPELANALAMLTLERLDHRRWAEAEKIVRECLAIREKKLPDDWRTFNARSMLGGALLGQKKCAEAEPLLLSGYEGLKQRQDTIPADGTVRLKEALQRLVQLYEATGRPDQAAEWKQKLAEFDTPAK
jgi:serine/threonine protein kinase/tetratricopeptide (TPR) repeat protein